MRELAERGVLRGQRGAYLSTADVAEVSVPATLQATIAARIDRLDQKAKRTLSAAAVIGSRFSLDLLTQLGVEPVVADLAAAQFIDQVRFTRQPEYVFHHPLIRAVAYEAQLKSDRAELHRRVAAAIELQSPESVDENAALIAEHLEAAGDLPAAYSAGICAPEPGRPTATSQRRWRAGGGRGRWPTSYLPMIRLGCRCAFRHEPCCVEPRFAWAVAAPRPASTNCANFASRRVICGRWRSAWSGLVTAKCMNTGPSGGVASGQ